jgi:hypothetical protein
MQAMKLGSSTDILPKSQNISIVSPVPPRRRLRKPSAPEPRRQMIYRLSYWQSMRMARKQRKGWTMRRRMRMKMKRITCHSPHSQH